MYRRHFLKLSALAGAGLLVNACTRKSLDEAAAATAVPPGLPISAVGFFSLHPFIEAHPEAVFIKRTDVTAETDEESKLREGNALAREILVFGSPAGIPLSHKIAIKANLTCTVGKGNTVEGMGIITDRSFMEGFVEGMKGLGFQASEIYMREGNWLKDGGCAKDLSITGYPEMAQRTGVHLLDMSSGRQLSDLTLETLQEGTEVVWKDCPEGVVFKRIGYVAPYNQENTWLMSVAKLKAHGMGMTLCAKNLQGICISPHVHFCEGVNTTLAYPPPILNDFQPNLEENVAKLHARHLEAGFPRWDRPGRDYNSGYGMEMWAQRTCDSLSVTKVGFCIIEGIYGRNGNGFMEGPGPNGAAEDLMTNVLIFGHDPFRVDIIGTWLAGHEPGNIGLFHIAKERGLSTVVNPMKIPVYLWEHGNAKLTPLDEFERVPLKTNYLRRDYNGQNEPLYHLVNEPFAYDS